MFFRKNKRRKKKIGPVEPIPMVGWQTLHDNVSKKKRDDSYINERNRDLARQLQAVR